MIIIFLKFFSKYGKDDKLYPKDVVTRAIVDQRLYFDMGTFYKAIGDVMVCRMVFYNLKIINISFIFLIFLLFFVVSTNVWWTKS